MYDEGSIILKAHMLLSSRKHFRAVALKGGRLSRAYARLIGKERREAATHLVKIINKPLQIFVFKLYHTSRILLPIQYVAELTLKLGYGFVKVDELFQGLMTGWSGWGLGVGGHS
jgi:hypothetical protein